MSRARIFLMLIIFMTCIAAPTFLSAQPYSANGISGTIQDDGGAAIVNAKISAKNVDTGILEETFTDRAGHFSLPDLAPGDYEITVSADGYGTNTLHVTVTRGRDAPADAAAGRPEALAEPA